MQRFDEHVARIHDYEPELELEPDEELRARYERLRERAMDGEPPEELLFESSRSRARPRGARSGSATSTSS